MEVTLWHQLGVATGMVGLTVVMHVLGLDLLQDLTRWSLTRFRALRYTNRITIPVGIVLGLFVLHGFEIWAYSLLYWRLDLLPTLEQALYFSTSAYSTVGETGAILPIPWRIVGVLEAVNGMLLIGWSTAFLYQILHTLTEDEDRRQALKGAIARSSPRRNGSRRGAASGTNSNDTEFMQ